MSKEDNWCHYSGMPSPNAYTKTKMNKKKKKITIEDVCKYTSNCSEKDLYFIKKSIDFNNENKLRQYLAENKRSKMFEDSTKL